MLVVVSLHDRVEAVQMQECTDARAQPLQRTRLNVCEMHPQAKGTGGARGYLAVSGGLDVPLYLGSRATFPGGALGGVQVPSPPVSGSPCSQPHLLSAERGPIALCIMTVVTKQCFMYATGCNDLKCLTTALPIFIAIPGKCASPYDWFSGRATCCAVSRTRMPTRAKSASSRGKGLVASLSSTALLREVPSWPAARITRGCHGDIHGFWEQGRPLKTGDLIPLGAALGNAQPGSEVPAAWLPSFPTQKVSTPRLIRFGNFPVA